ncbi:MAG: hypothetical protein H0W69_03105 [Gemmatimonadaceae bacterium]|nr:hypothetical protein [Gemmatimonadaceae bacterium]
MKAFLKGLSCLLVCAACGGAAGGGITPPPPPTDVCPNIAGTQTEVPSGMIKDNAGNCVTPPPVRIKDTLTVVIGRPDTLDLLPTDIFVDAVSTDSVTVQPTAWDAGFSLIVPTGQASIKLNFRGGSKYETRSYTVAGGNGLRYARVMHPNCWKIREGSFTGQTPCLSRAALTTPSGANDPLAFLKNGGMAPLGWAVGFIPKVSVVDPYDAGQNWTAADIASTALIVDSLNKAHGRILDMGTRSADTLPTEGVIKIIRESSESYQSIAITNSVAGEIHSVLIHVGKNAYPDLLNTLGHEVMHGMGEGHTCMWVTWMGSSACPSNQSTTKWFTAQDVAGSQIKDAIRAQSKKINANLSWF